MWTRSLRGELGMCQRLDQYVLRSDCTSTGLASISSTADVHYLTSSSFAMLRAMGTARAAAALLVISSVHIFGTAVG